MDLALWEIAIAILVAGVSYGALLASVKSVAVKVEALEKHTESEFKQVWNEMRQAEEQSKHASETILIRLAKIELTLERVAKWADRQQG
jgi:uncharacterized membrane-anchored protein YhcB (DUF1043 family)